MCSRTCVCVCVHVEPTSRSSTLAPLPSPTHTLRPSQHRHTLTPYHLPRAYHTRLTKPIRQPTQRRSLSHPLHSTITTAMGIAHTSVCATAAAGAAFGVVGDGVQLPPAARPAGRVAGRPAREHRAECAADERGRGFHARGRSGAAHAVGSMAVGGRGPAHHAARGPPATFWRAGLLFVDDSLYVLSACLTRPRAAYTLYATLTI